jgi:serine/threonine protein phosphatase 1
LRGNHEAMMENALKNASALELWLYNGGTATLRSYGGMENILKLHGPFYASLRNSFETDDFIFVHAGLRPGIEAKDQDPQDLVWIREEFIYEQTGLKKTVVYGHSPVQMYQSPYPDKIGIDTGAAYGGPLSAIELPQKKWRRFPDV